MKFDEKAAPISEEPMGPGRFRSILTLGDEFDTLLSDWMVASKGDKRDGLLNRLSSLSVAIRTLPATSIPEVTVKARNLGWIYRLSHPQIPFLAGDPPQHELAAVVTELDALIAGKELEEQATHITRALKSLHLGSHVLAGYLLAYLKGKPPQVFWSVFQRLWSDCDRTWLHRNLLISLLRANLPAYPHLTGSDAEFWRALPEQVTVYRGVDRTRWRGVSWTTDRECAEGFAAGHRGMRNRDPVVAIATVNKSAILTVCADRDENEVLINPRRLSAKLEAPRA